MKKDNDTIKRTYMIDDSIVYNRIDELLTDIDPAVLNKVDDYQLIKEDIVNESDYEPYNFEEEELEEDDYHYDDLD